MALELVGGAALGTVFGALYDVVKVAISRTAVQFKPFLGDLKFTLDSLRPRIIQQIGEHNLALGLPNDEIENLQQQMEEGVKLVVKLSKLGTWNCNIWCSCCNCTKPSYMDQLVELDRSLRILLEILKLQEARDVKEALLLARKIHDKQDELDKRLSDLLKVQQEAGLRGQQERSVREFSGSNTQTTVQNRIEGNGVQGAALGAAFGVLFGAVIQVKDKTKMFKCPLGYLKSTLDSLKPLIEEIAECNRVLHLPKEELESFRIQMEKGVELIHKCSEVHRWAGYKRYEYTNKLLGLDESLQRFLYILRVQLARDVRESLVSVSNIEMAIKQIEGSGVAQNDQIGNKDWCALLEPPSATIRLDASNGQGTWDVIKETLVLERKMERAVGSGVVQFASDQIEIKGSCEVVEPPSPAVGLDVLNVQTREIEEGVKKIEGSGVVQNQFEIKGSCAEVEPSLPAVGFDVLNVQGTRDVKETSDSASNKDAAFKQIEGGGVVQNIDIAVTEPPSPTVGLDVMKMRGTMDENKTLVSVRVGADKQIEGIEEVEHQAPVAECELPSITLGLSSSKDNQQVINREQKMLSDFSVEESPKSQQQQTWDFNKNCIFSTEKTGGKSEIEFEPLQSFSADIVTSHANMQSSEPDSAPRLVHCTQLSNSNSRTVESHESLDILNFPVEKDHPTFVASESVRLYQANEIDDQSGGSSSQLGGSTSIGEKERVAFKTKSDVEILDDGFKWRNYGKKTVKNSPYPRNYYKCLVEGCPVTKRVERDREDPSFVITTYEGTHKHQFEIKGSCAVVEPPSPAVGFDVLNVQGTRDVNETLDSTMNMEALFKKIEGSGVVQNIDIAVTEPASPSVGLDVMKMKGTRDENETLVSVREAADKQIGKPAVVELQAPVSECEPSSLPLGLDVQFGLLDSMTSSKDNQQALGREQKMFSYFSFQPEIRPIFDIRHSSNMVSVEESLKSQQQTWDFNKFSSQTIFSTEKTTGVKSEIDFEPLQSFCTNFGTIHANMQRSGHEGAPESDDIHCTQSSQRVSEHKSDDGFNWRKYGQKQVKGSGYPRSYYKCTYPNCPTKKKVERSLDGQITEIVYKGTHNHPKPQSTRRSTSSYGISDQLIPTLSGLKIESDTMQEDSLSAIREDDFEQNSPIRNPGGSEDENDPRAKRWEGENANDQTFSASGSRIVREPRIMVQTISEVDVLDDGYRWKKYGQKVVRGSPYPRSYYKCANARCPVRKHVERSVDDPRSVVTTYEGAHHHDAPTARGSGSYCAANKHAAGVRPLGLPLLSMGVRPLGLPEYPNLRYLSSLENTLQPTTESQATYEGAHNHAAGNSSNSIILSTGVRPLDVPGYSNLSHLSSLENTLHPTAENQAPYTTGS